MKNNKKVAIIFYAIALCGFLVSALSFLSSNTTAGVSWILLGVCNLIIGTVLAKMPEKTTDEKEESAQ